MNRCATLLNSRPKLSIILLIGLAALTTDPALAQGLVRHFPDAALRATFQVTAPPEVLINGQPARLAPGARIKGINNLLVLSGGLVGQTLLVNYVKDPQGQIRDIWILTPQEAQEKRAGMPLTNIVFGSDVRQTNTEVGK